MDEGPGRVLLEALLERHPETALEPLPATRSLGEELHRAEIVEGVGEDVPLVQALCELDRTRAPGERPLGVLGVHVPGRHQRVGSGELATRRQPLEHVDRLPRGVIRLAVLPGAVQASGERAKRVGLLATVAERPIALQRGADVGDRVLGERRHVALLRAAFEQLAALAQIEAVREPKRSRVLGGGLTVRAKRGRPLARRGCELEYPRSIVGRLGVMRIRAGSGPPSKRLRSAESTSRCNATRRYGGMASSTASRASS
jgi:hypothetical protein